MLFKRGHIKKISFVAIIGLMTILVLLFNSVLLNKINNKLIRNNTKKIVLDIPATCKGGLGLGNQFFMFASAYSFAQKHGIKDLVINNLSLANCEDCQENFNDANSRSYGLSKFGINYPVMHDFQDLTPHEKSIAYTIKSFKQLQTINSVRDFKLKSKSHVLIIPPLFESTRLSKYYASIQHNEQILKNIFKYNQPLSAIAKDLLKKIKSDNSVGVHVRRGDYVGLKRHISLNYYVKALDALLTKLQDPQLFIFTDDVEYVKSYFKDQANIKKVNFKNQNTGTRIYQLLNNAVYVSEKINHSLEEFHLMSNCKHNIIANSTFSWWAAFLNNNPNKIVIVPKSFGKCIFGRFATKKNWISME